jgi:hypothetical protein
MRKQTYAAGTYIVRDDLSYAADVRDLITSARFQRFLSAHPDRLAVAAGRRNSLYTFYFPPAGKALVMKVTRLDPQESVWRRIDWYQRRLRKDYAEVAFYGALQLEEAGIGTAKPVAYWSCGTSWWNRESYFLYEHVEARTIDSYTEEASAYPTSCGKLVLRGMIEKTIEMVRCLHAHGLRHGDIHGGNVLVSVDADGRSPDGHASASRLRLYLIDTDHVCRARVRLPLVKRFFDLRCLHCIDFHGYGRRSFLQNYLGKDHRAWWWVLNFWSRGGFKIGDWFKPPKYRVRRHMRQQSVRALHEVERSSP